MAKWKWLFIAAWCCFGLFIVAAATIDGDIGMAIGLISFLACIVLVIVGCVVRGKDPAVKAEIEKKKEEAQLKAVKRQEEAHLKAVQRRENRNRAKRLKSQDNRPVEATLITTSDRTKTTKSAVSAAGRAIVGGVIAGPAGAVLGAATTSGKTSVTEQRATFFVKYESGRTGTETVKVGSDRFNELATVMK